VNRDQVTDEVTTPAAGRPVLAGRAARAVRTTVTVVVFIIAGLAFGFGFGNGWTLGLRLGVPGWIAPLVAPAVDLSVVALLVAVQYLSAHGIPGRQLVAARLLLVVCGLATLALNVTQPVLVRSWGRACFDAVPPLLLIGWSEVGPRLLALLHSPATSTSAGTRTGTVLAPVLAVPDRPAPTTAGSNTAPAGSADTAAVGLAADERDRPRPVPDRPATSSPSPAGSSPAPSPAGSSPAPSSVDSSPRPVPHADLIASARRAAAAHQSATGKRITRDGLRARLRVSNAVAGELLRHLDPEPTNPADSETDEIAGQLQLASPDRTH
jgi:hypothetical protein